MSAGLPIVVDRLGKSFGPVHAVSDLSFEVRPGRVTGFLGPNGAGKTTTLRMLLGLVRPSTGSALIGGRSYGDLDDPARTVGASLEAAFHPGRTGRGHLETVALGAGIPRSAIPDVLRHVGMAEYADRRVGGYSLGMRQRLGLAGALLGDPGVLVLDEPANGLDPEGIRWMRTRLRELAAEGRTVLLSSHLLAEVQQTVDDVIVIAGGRLRYAGLAAPEGAATRVDAPDREALAAALRASGFEAVDGADGLLVRGAVPAEVGRIALAAGVALSALAPHSAGLEDDFLALIGEEDAP